MNGEIVNTIISMISSVGFPIAMCIYTMYTMDKANTIHMTEISKLSETIDNNTKAINELNIRMGGK